MLSQSTKITFHKLRPTKEVAYVNVYSEENGIISEWTQFNISDRPLADANIDIMMHNVIDTPLHALIFYYSIFNPKLFGP